MSPIWRLTVSIENVHGVERFGVFRCLVYIPEADCVVIRSGQQIAFLKEQLASSRLSTFPCIYLVRVPGESVSFLRVSLEAQFRVASRVGVGNGGMFGVVKDEHVAGGRFCADNVRILRHVSRAVHLSLVVDSNLHVNLSRNRTEPTEFALNNSRIFSIVKNDTNWTISKIPLIDKKLRGIFTPKIFLKPFRRRTRWCQHLRPRPATGRRR